jgi:hypothetical protein
MPSVSTAMASASEYAAAKLAEEREQERAEEARQ